MSSGGVFSLSHHVLIILYSVVRFSSVRHLYSSLCSSSGPAALSFLRALIVSVNSSHVMLDVSYSSFSLPGRIPVLSWYSSPGPFHCGSGPLLS